MIGLIQHFITRNIKSIPYFFQRNPEPSLSHHNFALMGRLTSSILHDILTPITSLSLATPIIERESAGELGTVVSESTRQITEFVEIMKEFLNENSNEKTVHINREIHKSILLMSHKAKQAGVQIQFLELDQVYSKTCPLYIYQIVVNLISNAIDASVECTTKKVIIIIKKEKGLYTIDCKDFGVGIESSIINSICRANFTTKANGYGFGLYSVKHIITQRLFGEMKIYSEPNEGSLFSCRLPIRK